MSATSVPDGINPRYYFYSKAHGRTHEEMLEYDRKRYPGGCMCGFILWITAKWREWESLTGNTPPRLTSDYRDFDEWLKGVTP